MPSLWGEEFNKAKIFASMILFEKIVQDLPFGGIASGLQQLLACVGSFCKGRVQLSLVLLLDDPCKDKLAFSPLHCIENLVSHSVFESNIHFCLGKASGTPPPKKLCSLCLLEC